MTEKEIEKSSFKEEGVKMPFFCPMMYYNNTYPAPMRDMGYPFTCQFPCQRPDYMNMPYGNYGMCSYHSIPFPESDKYQKRMAKSPFFLKKVAVLQ